MHAHGFASAADCFAAIDAAVAAIGARQGVPVSLPVGAASMPPGSQRTVAGEHLHGEGAVGPARLGDFVDDGADLGKLVEEDARDDGLVRVVLGAEVEVGDGARGLEAGGDSDAGREEAGERLVSLEVVVAEDEAMRHQPRRTGDRGRVPRADGRARGVRGGWRDGEAHGARDGGGEVVEGNVGRAGVLVEEDETLAGAAAPADSVRILGAGVVEMDSVSQRWCPTHEAIDITASEVLRAWQSLAWPLSACGRLSRGRLKRVRSRI